MSKGNHLAVPPKGYRTSLSGREQRLLRLLWEDGAFGPGSKISYGDVARFMHRAYPQDGGPRSSSGIYKFIKRVIEIH